MFELINTKEKKYVIPESEEEYLLQFDGCSKGNPGKAGSGAVIYKNKNEIWGKSLFIGDKNTNNEAEYIGLIIGLEEATNMGIKKLYVEGDSLLVIKQMKGEYKVKAENLYKLYELYELYKLNLLFIIYKYIKLKKIKKT